ncbi:MAG: hypothetical protein ACRERC_20370 [Candidatus Binatia bacterium]
MTAAKGRKKQPAARSAKAETEISDLLAQLVRAQVKVVNRVGKFTADAAAMSLAGVVSPTKWMDLYAKMWTDLAADLAKKS